MTCIVVSLHRSGRIIVKLMDIIAVRLILFFFCKIVLCTVCKSQSYFIMLSPRLSVTNTICLHFHFAVNRSGTGGI